MRCVCAFVRTSSMQSRLLRKTHWLFGNTVASTTPTAPIDILDLLDEVAYYGATGKLNFDASSDQYYWTDKNANQST